MNSPPGPYMTWYGLRPCTGIAVQEDESLMGTLYRSLQAALDASEAAFPPPQPFIGALSDVSDMMRVWGQADFPRPVTCVAPPLPGSTGVVLCDIPTTSLSTPTIGPGGVDLVPTYVQALDPQMNAVALLTQTVEDVCRTLSLGGEQSLADRIAYFASHEDLEPGDVPVADKSARGFLSFFSRVTAPEAELQLTCSPEGWLCASWRFPDSRGASLWFLDENRVMFAATGADGKFIEIDGTEQGDSKQVQSKLVQAGLFSWVSDTVSNKSFNLNTTWADTVLHEPWIVMECRARKPFASGHQSAISPPTGWSTSTAQTVDSKSTVLSTL